jgi:hypothetical protein
LLDLRLGLREYLIGVDFLGHPLLKVTLNLEEMSRLLPEMVGLFHSNHLLQNPAVFSPDLLHVSPPRL